MIAEHDADGFEGKVATVALDEEVAMVREVRAAIGPDRELRLDANGGWTVPTARDALRRLDAYDIRYYEDPVETNEEMAALRPATRASFSSHLTDLRKAVALGAPDTIVSNVNEFGGIRRVVEFARACERFDVGFRFHSGETGIGSAAYLHLSAAIASVREPSQTLFRWYADDVIAEGPFVPKGGLVEVPTGPGLGVTLDPVALARCHERYRTEGPFPGGPGKGGYGEDLPPPVSDADEIAAALAAAGTEVCFGVPGGGVNLDLVGACGRHGIRFVLTHTETAAVIAAGVWGELTGRPGLALCTRGPGLAAALNGIAQAHLDRQPVIVVDGRRRLRAPAPAHRPRRDGGAAVEGHRERPGGGGRAGAGAALGAGADRCRRARARGSDRLSRPRRRVTSCCRPRRGRWCSSASRARGSEAAIRDLVRDTPVPVLTTYKAKGAVPESWPNAAGLLTGGTIEAPLLRRRRPDRRRRARSGRADPGAVAVRGADRVADAVAEPARAAARAGGVHRPARPTCSPGSSWTAPAGSERAPTTAARRWSGSSIAGSGAGHVAARRRPRRPPGAARRGDRDGRRRRPHARRDAALRGRRAAPLPDLERPRDDGLLAAGRDRGVADHRRAGRLPDGRRRPRHVPGRAGDGRAPGPRPARGGVRRRDADADRDQAGRGTGRRGVPCATATSTSPPSPAASDCAPTTVADAASLEAAVARPGPSLTTVQIDPSAYAAVLAATRA